MDKTNSDKMQQIILMFSMLITQGISLTDDQIQSIQRILWGAMNPSVTLPEAQSAPAPYTSSTELIYGLSGLASFLKVSLPTAARYRERYEPARVRFGGRKMVWDKAKLVELAKNNKW